jgi:hypothetical protein
LTAIFAIGLLVSGGCITAQPTIEFTSDDSDVFEDISTADRWGVSSVQSSVTLATGATTTEGVTSLSVVTQDGGSYYTTTVDAGQTSVTLPLPLNTPATIVATNTVNGTTVGNATVRISDDTYP